MKEAKIPQSLKECFHFLDKLLSVEQISTIQNLDSYNEMINYHMDLGMYIRNNWIYCENNEKLLEDLGYPKGMMYMADFVSGEILDYYWFYKKGYISENEEIPELRKLCKMFDKGKLNKIAELIK